MARSADLASALALAARGIAAVRAGRALDEALAGAGADAAPAERAAARDIAYRACRRLNLLSALTRALLARPTPALDALLAVALSELIDHPARAHRSVDQAVRAAAPVRGGAYKPVVNATLRRFARESEALLAAARAREPEREQHARWWIQRVRAAWPDQWQAVLAAGNSHPPLTLRVNRRRADQGSVVADLAAAGIAAHPVGTHAVRVERPRPTRELPGFAAGRFSVQDLGAQAAAPLLEVADGMRVLDACAAPGGKAAHLLEGARCDLLALDRDSARLADARALLDRLGLAARLAVADAGAPATWWDGTPFDRVLLDAPCTASGIVRRHPDAKWLRRESDIAALAGEQARLLAALWSVLKPGGKLLYATCSVFPEENARQVAAFLTSHPDASLDAARSPLATGADGAGGTSAPRPRDDHDDCPGALHLLPDDLHDGFFYARLAKAA